MKRFLSVVLTLSFLALPQAFAQTKSKPATKNKKPSQALSAKRARAFQKKEKGAVSAADKWLKYIDSNKFAEGWKTSALVTRKSVSRKKWLREMGKIRKKYGKLKSREFVTADYSTVLPDLPPGQYFIVRYQSKYQKKPVAIETVTQYLDKDGRWRPAGYLIK